MSYHPLGAPPPLPQLPPLPTAAQLKADAATSAKAIATDAGEQALAQYPKASELAGQFNESYAFVKNYPLPRDMSVDGAKQWGVDVMKGYLKDQGIPTSFSQKDLEDIASGAFKTELGAELDKYGIPPEILQGKAKLQDTFEQLAFTAVAAETGIDPRVITVTWDSLKDGKLSESDCENIGAAAGAIAGAAIGQAFGIPAPIGAFIGGMFGKMIGGTVAQIFGIGDQNAYYKALFAREWGAVVQYSRDASAQCTELRQNYWRTFDRLILSTEQQWEKIEAQLGWRFQLRYFGPATTTAFLRAYNPKTRQYDGPFITSPGLSCTTRDELLYDANGVMTRSQGRQCWCIASYGCPYPVVPGQIPSPDEYSRRVTEAFMLRGAVWIPDYARDTRCDYGLPDAAAALDGNQRASWIRYITTLGYTEQAHSLNLQRITQLVIGDLLQTAGSVAAEKAIYDNRQQLLAHGITLRDTKAKEVAAARLQASEQSSFLNWAALIGGAGLAAYAWRRRG